MSFDRQKIKKEIAYKATRSSGPGGQHANKTSTKVILEWNLEESAVFSIEQKTRLRKRVGNRMTKEGLVQISAERTRSQARNKELVTQQFFELLKEALRKRKKRRSPKPGKKFHEKRLQQKKQNSEKKQNRKRMW